jgi:hypothetical protein
MDLQALWSMVGQDQGAHREPDPCSLPLRGISVHAGRSSSDDVGEIEAGVFAWILNGQLSMAVARRSHEFSLDR